MKKYAVYGPITGRFYIEVEAESEEEALDMVYNLVDSSYIEEWELGAKRDIDVDLIKDEE